MSTRNSSGRFTGSGSNSSFDLAKSLRGLFRAAEKAGDFTGAASIARVIKDVGPPDAESRTTTDDFPDLKEQLFGNGYSRATH